LHREGDRGKAGPPIRMLLMAALVPFAVIGLLASPIAFDAVRHLAGF
jgi:hypothetical protein